MLQHSFIFVCMFIFICAFLFGSCVGGFPPTELQALQDLYQDTQGDNWVWQTDYSQYGIPWNITGSLTSNPCLERWQGVVCGTGCSSVSSPCNVQKLLLSGYNLNGTLPVSFGQLSSMVELDLSTNLIYGTIPESVKNLQYLTVISLQHNFITGDFPIVFTYLNHLEELTLDFNMIGGNLPANISMMSQLSHFSCNNNFLSGQIPSSIGNISALTYLDFANNYMSGTLPDSLQYLSKLTLLRLYLNKLNGSIPDSIGNLSACELIDIGSNLFTGRIPSSIGMLSSVLFLFLNNNQLEGSLPAAMGNMTTLEAIVGYNNMLTGTIPQTVWMMPNLQALSLSSNLLEGTIPASINSLYVLDIGSNFFTGRIFDIICAQPILVQHMLLLTIQQNAFSGSITADCTFPILQHLRAEDNFFTGSFNGMINDWSLLHIFNGSNNFFTQTLYVGNNPSSKSIFDGLINLQNIDLTENLLSGGVANAFTNNIDLQLIIFRSNFFTGPLDTFISPSIQGLAVIDVSDNQFSGTLPDNLFVGKSALISFAAVKNCLTGSIPTAICQAASLQTLALDGLQTASACQRKLFPFIQYPYAINSYALASPVQGSIPYCLWNMTQLTTLHLSGNGMTGTLPADIVIGPNLVDVELSYNSFSGTIPSVIKSKKWQSLDLSFNKLGGTVDDLVEGSSSMTLSQNRLSGEIPDSAEATGSLDILRGNLFSCKQLSDIEVVGDKSQGSVPNNDINADRYSCGTNSIDSTLWLYFFLVIVCLVGFAGFFLTAKSSKQMIQFERIRKQCQTWYEFLVTCWEISTKNTMDEAIAQKRLSLYLVGQHFKQFRFLALRLTLFVLILSPPLYFVISQFYETHTNAYAWTFSIAYLSGLVPAVVILVFGWICLAWMEYIFWMVSVTAKQLKENVKVALQQNKSMMESEKESFHQEVEEEFRADSFATVDHHAIVSVDKSMRDSFLEWKSKLETNREWLVNHWKYVLVGVILLLGNIIVVLTLNILYVYGVTTGMSTTELFFSTIGLSIFKITWNNVVVLNIFSKYLKFKEKPIELSKATTLEVLRESIFTFKDDVPSANSLSSIQRVMWLSSIFIFNRVIAPFIANIFFEYDCFYYAVRSPPTITTNYNLEECALEYIDVNTLTLVCYKYQTIQRNVDYSPPFVYSYQCSSSLLKDFMVVFITQYIISTFMFPIGIVLFSNFQWLDPSFIVAKPSANRNKTAGNLGSDVELVSLAESANTVQNPIRIISSSKQIEEDNESNNEIKIEIKTEDTHNVGPALLSNAFSREPYVILFIADLSVLLTFGIAFPPLAWLIATSMFINSYTHQLLLGRNFLVSGDQHEDTDIASVDKEDENEYANLMQLLRPMEWALKCLCALFLAFFLFDILGDAVGAVDACWISVVMGTAPLWIELCKALYRKATDRRVV